MPNLSAFVENGVMGNAATMRPDLSPMLWTSIATGKRPFKHGIHGFIEPTPNGEGIRPITNLSRKTKALWNILSQENKKCVVVGWWPSHPAEPINGVMVSNFYLKGTPPHGQPWPMKPGTVYPQRLIKNLSDLRVHPQELDVELILNFVPKLPEIDQDKDKHIETMACIIADCTNINRAATAILDHEPWDFAAIYFDSIDHFCHAFMSFHPPKLPWVSKDAFEHYQYVVESGYIYHDILLGTLLERTDDNTTVIICSDHGFHSDHLRPGYIPEEPAGPAICHRPYGIFAAKGPNILKDEIIYGASILDICPTILTAMGLPVGKDMDGKPLVNIFSSPPEIKVIESWDEISGNCGSHPPDMQIDPIESREAIDQLVALGYIDKPDDDKEKAASGAIRELKYNLAKSYMDAGRYKAAIAELSEIFDKWKEEFRFGIELIRCYMAIDHFKEARELLEDIIERKRQDAAKAAEELKAFSKEHEGQEELSDDDSLIYRRLKARKSHNPYVFDYLMGCICIAEGNNDKGLMHLAKAEEFDSRQPDIYIKIAQAYLSMRRPLDAKMNCEKSLNIDPDNPDAYVALARSMLLMKENKKAVEYALKATSLRFHDPLAHFTIGVGLHRLGKITGALNAMKLAVMQNPVFPEAHRRLAFIYKKYFSDDALSGSHIELSDKAKEAIKKNKRDPLSSAAEIEEVRKSTLTNLQVVSSSEAPPMELDKTVIVVTGLPRSGTSMLMQILESGGIEVYTDGLRKPDEDNVRGYYEHEKAKGLHKDSSWLAEAKGKAVKIIAQSLPQLPRYAGGAQGVRSVENEITYRVIYIERDIDEVLSSQKVMLARHNKTGKGQRLKTVFTEQLAITKEVLNRRSIPFISLNYSDTLNNPDSAVRYLNKFLNGALNEKKAASAVDPLLKRH